MAQWGQISAAGQKRHFSPRQWRSAYPPIADMLAPAGNGREVPKATSGSLLNDFVGGRE
jgi:hypothetical protein